MLKLTVFTSGDQAQMILARLSQFDIDGAEEKDDSIEIYVNEAVLSEDAFQAEIKFIQSAGDIEISTKKFEEENWNAKWESSYHPVTIGKNVRIRASFHKPDQHFKYEILIDPQMSFGTGHHATTTLVIRKMTTQSFEGKTVLDMGCGTGVLGILASMMGASQVDAIDIDRWSFENAQQNAKLNGIRNMTVMQGGKESIPNKKYDVILANINREIVIGQLATYRDHLKENGTLLTSGFLSDDEKRMVQKARQAGFDFVDTLQDANWLLIAFKVKNE